MAVLGGWVGTTLLIGLVGASGDGAPPIGTPIADFELTGARGEVHRLGEWRGSRLVTLVFLGAECPVAELYAATLSELAADPGKWRIPEPDLVLAMLEPFTVPARGSGAPPIILPEGMAKRVPAGWRLVFVVPYAPIGSNPPAAGTPRYLSDRAGLADGRLRGWDGGWHCADPPC